MRRGTVTECGPCGHDKAHHTTDGEGGGMWCAQCHAACDFSPRIGRPPIEGEKTVTRSYSMLPGEHAIVADLAREWGCSASAAMARMVREHATYHIEETDRRGQMRSRLTRAVEKGQLEPRVLDLYK